MRRHDLLEDRGVDPAVIVGDPVAHSLDTLPGDVRNPEQGDRTDLLRALADLEDAKGNRVSRSLVLRPARAVLVTTCSRAVSASSSSRRNSSRSRSFIDRHPLNAGLLEHLRTERARHDQIDAPTEEVLERLANTEVVVQVNDAVEHGLDEDVDVGVRTQVAADGRAEHDDPS